MKKEILFLMLLFTILVSPFSIAAIEVKKIDKGSVVISELNNPAVFDFEITNNGESDTFEIYSLVGVSMSPKGTFDLPSGTKTIQVKAYPSKEIRKQLGFYNFEYEIRGQNSGIFKDKLQIKIAELQGAVEVGAGNINPDDNNATIIVKNTQNAYLEDVSFHFGSAFFDVDKKVSLEPFQEVKISVSIDKSKTRTLVAGPYIITADIKFENSKATTEGTFNYLEKEGTSITKESSGFLVRKTVITKTNEGNVPLTASIESSRDILTRLFTVYSKEPTSTERGALTVTYSWQQQLAPGESFNVVSSTNYTLPFVLLVLIVFISIMAKIYTRTSLILSKQVSYVKTKGGEFALKVRIYVKADKYVENIQIYDTVPSVMKLYQNFGNKPDNIDVRNRRLVWNIDRLNAGEERVFSYIIYSKINVVGRFELPATTAIYQREGKMQEAFSNRAFFVADTTRTLDKV